MAGTVTVGRRMTLRRLMPARGYRPAHLTRQFMAKCPGLWWEMGADLPAPSPRLARYAADDATRCLCHAVHLDPFLRDYVLRCSRPAYAAASRRLPRRPATGPYGHAGWHGQCVRPSPGSADHDRH